MAQHYASSRKNLLQSQAAYFERHRWLVTVVISVLWLPHGHDCQFINSIGLRMRGPADGVIPMGIEVISSEPPDGTIVKQGMSTTLTCSTNVNWFFCVWRSPHGNKQCAIQETTTQNVCSGDNRIILKGSKNKCQVELRTAIPDDHGEWSCLLTDAEDLATDKATIAIEVGIQAKVEFDPSYNNNVLRLTEGDVEEIRCAAKGGHPAPQLSWLEPTNSQVDLTAEPEIVTLGSAYTTDVYHTIKYKASLQDDNAAITCIATQLNRNGKDVLYENMAEIKLKVDKLILPVDNALTQKIGIISGVLLAIIFIILLIIFIVFLICKRRRKRSRPPSSQATDDTTPEPIKPIWTTDRGIGTTPLKTYKPKPDFQQRLNHNQVHRHPTNSAQSTTTTGKKNNNIHSNACAPLPHTLSQGTVSTQSTNSHGSWEEDRSVGGELEDGLVTRSLMVVNCHQRYEQPAQRVQTASLQETHFDSDMDLETTNMHHRDPFFCHQQPARSQRSNFLGRPSSSMANSSGPCQGNLLPRPTSALGGGPLLYDPQGSRRMPPSNDQLTTSVKSVFDCDLGCFANEDGHLCAGHQAQLANESRTSEPHEV